MNKMKKYNLALAASLFAATALMSCGGGETAEQKEAEENTPGPVTENDKSRYNLNSADEPLYGTTDTLKQDSLQKADSLKKATN